MTSITISGFSFNPIGLILIFLLMFNLSLPMRVLGAVASIITTARRAEVVKPELDYFDYNPSVVDTTEHLNEQLEQFDKRLEYLEQRLEQHKLSKEQRIISDQARTNLLNGFIQ